MSIKKLIKELITEVDQYDDKVRAGIWKSTHYEDGKKYATLEIVERLKAHQKRKMMQKSLEPEYPQWMPYAIFAIPVGVVIFIAGWILGGR